VATYQDKSFSNQAVLVDGNRYEKCSFINCNLMYRGGDLPVFDACVFQGGNIQLEGAAFKTVKYLSSLNREGLGDSVDTVITEVQAGNPTLAARPLPPTPEMLGTNFGQLGRVAGVLAVITLLLAAAIWYGAGVYPQNVLRQEPARPLSEQVPLSIMPQLPAELGVAYDQLRADQFERLGSFGWVDRQQGIVRIPIDAAMNLVIQDGVPSWTAGGN
jgi:hypothetical protein